MRLAPAGARVALSDGWEPGGGTVIYDGDTLVGAASGRAMGWIDDDRLLVEEYGWDNEYVVPVATRICDPSGAVLTTLATTIPFGASPPGNWSTDKPRRFTAVSSSQIYVPGTNRIYSLADGQVVWSSSVVPGSDSNIGDYAGGYVVISPGWPSPRVYIEQP
jgi:hypothetical protein